MCSLRCVYDCLSVYVFVLNKSETGYFIFVQAVFGIYLFLLFSLVVSV